MLCVHDGRRHVIRGLRSHGRDKLLCCECLVVGLHHSAPVTVEMHVSVNYVLCEMTEMPACVELATQDFCVSAYALVSHG